MWALGYFLIEAPETKGHTLPSRSPFAVSHLRAKGYNYYHVEKTTSTKRDVPFINTGIQRKNLHW